jgi:glucan 1,3-beta-glucosidase
VMDSVITNTPVAVLTATSATSLPPTGGSLILDNVHVKNVATIVQSASGQSLLGGPGQGEATVDSWGQGHMYNDKSGRGSFS